MKSVGGSSNSLFEKTLALLATSVAVSYIRDGHKH
jgi:hypothetical protein